MKHKMLLLFAVTLLLGACASGGSRGTALYTREIGNASLRDALDRTNLLLTRLHYEVQEVDSVPFIRMETRWRPRPVFVDEQALGITAGENRLILNMRVRGEADINSVYNVRMTVENRVKVAGDAEWNDRSSTPQFIAYADSVVAEFKKEFANIGVRRY